MTTVTLKNLTQIYPSGLTAVDDFSLTIPHGQLMALLGPSGCGKTTLLRLIAGLIKPTRGDILFDGQSVGHLPPQKRRAVMVFQQHQLFPFMTVADNIAFGLKAKKLDKATIAAKVDQALEMVHLAGYQHRLSDELSGGEQQRIALARVLILEPNLLLLDEPLSNLDAGLRQDLRELIRYLQQATGVTTLFVTHDQNEAVAIADCIGLMSNGQLKQLGLPCAFFEHPVDIDVARFFGGVNFMTAEKSGYTLKTSLGTLETDSTAPDGRVTITIRPEAIQVARNGSNNIKVRVKQYSYQGLITKCVTRVGDVELQLVLPYHHTLQVGDEIDVHLPKDKIWLLPPHPIEAVDP